MEYLNLNELAYSHKKYYKSFSVSAAVDYQDSN